MAEPEAEGSIEGVGEVREEDAFDLEAATAWLAGQGVELDAPVEVRQFAGGASNLTYSLRTPSRDLILRRPPSGRKAKGAHDMGREYRIQAALKQPFGLVADMLAYCEDESVIGSPFYAMQRVDGIIPRQDFPPGVDLDEPAARRLCENALDTLVRLHRVDPDDSEALSALGKGTGYVERQITGWNARFRAAVTDDFTPDRVASGERVMAWLEAHMPDDVANCVIHNDFRFDNLVLSAADPTEIVAVLDWEMATLGDPLMDLGGTMAYWIGDDDDDFFQHVRRQPTNLPGMFSRAEFVERYCEQMGYSVSSEQWRFYEAYGLFRLAGIAQQIYYRYFEGQTTNEAYARFGPLCEYLVARCDGLLDPG